MRLLYKDLTDQILKAFFNVYNELGYGFLEKVYENALAYELSLMGMDVQKQYPISVYYKDKKVGAYFADILVDETIILELKATPIKEMHEFQLLHYLKATDIELGLLLSFGKEARFVRKIFENRYKEK
jgi:GxxExxY protein